MNLDAEGVAGIWGFLRAFSARFDFSRFFPGVTLRSPQALARRAAGASAKEDRLIPYLSGHKLHLGQPFSALTHFDEMLLN